MQLVHVACGCKHSLKYFLCTLIVSSCIRADGTTLNLLAKLSAPCTENTVRDIVKSCSKCLTKSEGWELGVATLRS